MSYVQAVVVVESEVTSHTKKFYSENTRHLDQISPADTRILILHADKAVGGGGSRGNGIFSV